MRHNIESYWYSTQWNWFAFLLRPFSWLFALCVAARRYSYKRGWIKTRHFPVPVIIVGNITVGGTGKTPCVIWLASYLQSLGYKPGIVSRGVGGARQVKPYWVKPSTLAIQAGDEAVLIAQRSACPVVVCVDRVAAVRDLLQHSQCNIVISDDGLQHYRLGRDIEIVLVDGLRHFGNGCLLPAGPLREPQSRLKNADFVLVNEGKAQDAYTMRVTPTKFVSLYDENNILSLESFASKKIHAVAGIGHPERFFQALRKAGFEVVPHVFPDHYLYQASDLAFNDDLPVVMTEKDAVKCKLFADKRYWSVSVRVSMSPLFEQALLTKLQHIGSNYYGLKQNLAQPFRKPVIVNEHDSISS